MKRLVSPYELNAKRDLPAIKWTLSWMNWYLTSHKNKCKIVEINQVTLQKRIQTSGKTFVLYRMQMLQLLNFPKPVFDQLAIELPCLMGFRANEVATLRAEYLDFQNMNTKVMDAKKHKLMTVPLNLYAGEHIEQILNGRTEGVVLGSRSNRNKGEQITPIAVWYIWDKWTKRAKLPNAKDISPNTGRQLFAGLWHHLLKLSLITLSKIMRHSHPMITLSYVQQLIFYEDVKTDYHSFQESMAKAQDKFQFNKMMQKEA